MKKTILLILAVLPIVLLVIIAFAGQILSVYQHISVERVEFVDKLGNVYTKEHTFTVEQGTSKETMIRIYPELSSNKKVTYTSSDESICTVDSNGVITGVHYGYTTVIVKTDDGAKVAVLNVKVKADVPYAVYLNKNEHTMLEGEVYPLGVTVDAPVAVNKNVTYTSDNPGVATVDPTGKITAVSEGVAVITVTTVSGELTDTCIVTVEKPQPDKMPDIYFDFSEIAGVELMNGVYVIKSTTIDITDAIRIADHINPDDVVIKLQSGNAALEDGTLTFSQMGVVTIRVFVGDEENATAFAEIKIGYRG